MISISYRIEDKYAKQYLLSLGYKTITFKELSNDSFYKNVNKDIVRVWNIFVDEISKSILYLKFCYKTGEDLALLYNLFFYYQDHIVNIFLKGNSINCILDYLNNSSLAKYRLSYYVTMGSLYHFRPNNSNLKVYLSDYLLKTVINREIGLKLNELFSKTTGI